MMITMGCIRVLVETMPQSVVPPTLGVTSLTPEFDSTAPTATTATKAAPMAGCFSP